MKPILKKVYRTMLNYGFDAKRFIQAIRPVNKGWFYDDLKALKRQKANDTSFALSTIYPILNERHKDAGSFKKQYFQQDLFVATLIHEANPKLHLDIGSRIDGFVAHVASFRKIELIDIRPVQAMIKNISFRQADLMQLPADLIDKYDSISSLHAIEHFGLGRYGDPIDYTGHLKALANIARMLKGNGTFYFSVPIGPQRIEFNAQRVFSIAYLMEILSGDFNVRTFSYIDDKGDFVEDVDLVSNAAKRNFGCNCGCGIFVLTKKEQ